MLHSVEVDLGGGRTITLETGKMAKQANGSVIVRSGESVVLVTACTPMSPRSEPTSSRSPSITVSTPTPPGAFPAASSSAKAAHGERNSHLPPDRPAPSARCSPKAIRMKPR